MSYWNCWAIEVHSWTLGGAILSWAYQGFRAFLFPKCGHVTYQIKGKAGHAYTKVIFTMAGLCREVFFEPVGDSCIA